LFPTKLFARPQVMALVGDVVSSEQASARHVTNPTPVEAGSSSSDWTPLTQAPSPLSQDSTTADEFGSLARSSGTAFQRVTTIRAALKFEERAHDRAQFAPRSQDKAGSENLGAPNFRPTADTEALALAKQKYVNEATERLSAFPLTAIDASFRRTMLVCGDTRVAVRRDVLRYGLNAGFFGNVVPLLHAALLDATAVSEVATGRTVLILGPRRSGKTTVAMHAIAAGRGRIGLVADGVTAMCAGSSALNAGFGLDWGRGAAAIASERVKRILTALQRAGGSSGIPHALADNDVVLLGAPLHPLVCAGSLCAPRGSSGPASAQLRAYAIAAKKAADSDSAVAFDACDSAWLQHGLHWMDDDRVSANSRWNSQASIRVDLTTCFGQTASSSSAQLQPCAGRLAGVLILDWKTPSDDAAAARGLAVPMNTEASTNPLAGSHSDPFANDSPSTTVSRFDMQRPDAREGLVTWLTANTCAPLLHRQLRPLRRAGLSAADAADLLATIADADPDERADPQLLGSAYAKAAAELFVRRLEDARQEVPVLSLHGDAVNFCDATRTVVRDLLHIE
jgi:RecA/RadA recombinase